MTVGTLLPRYPPPSTRKQTLLESRKFWINLLLFSNLCSICYWCTISCRLKLQCYIRITILKILPIKLNLGIVIIFDFMQNVWHYYVFGLFYILNWQMAMCMYLYTFWIWSLTTFLYNINSHKYVHVFPWFLKNDLITSKQNYNRTLK